MINRFMQLLAVVLALFVTTEASAAFTVKGRVSYNRNWFGNGYNVGSDIPLASHTGVHRLQDARVCVTHSGGTQTCGFTNSLGDYQFAVPSASGTYTRKIHFVGQSLVTPGGLGYRVVATGSGADTTPLTYTMSSFNGPASGTIDLSNHTIPVCTPAIATCGNDFANGHQVLMWAFARMFFTYQLNTISLWNQAADLIRARTDRTNTTSCGFSGNPFCFNFDFGSTDITTGWHELGHELSRQHGLQFGGTGQYGEFVGQDSCNLENSGGVEVNEALANLTAVLMGYSENTAGTLSSLNSFCFSTQQPANDAAMNCLSCEYGPNPNVYPQPSLACGPAPDFAIQRTECRALKMMVNLLDSQSNNTNCINESVNISFKQLWQLLVTVPSNTTEGGTKEVTIGGSATGNAVTGSDAFSMMDILEDVKTLYGVAPGELYKIWANGCYMPGEAGWATGTFLPSSQQGTPFP